MRSPPFPPQLDWATKRSQPGHDRPLTYVALGVEGRLLRTDAGVGYFNDVLQLPGLLLHFGCQEQRGLGNDLKRDEEGR